LRIPANVNADSHASAGIGVHVHPENSPSPVRREETAGNGVFAEPLVDRINRRHQSPMPLILLPA
jgi:hypothetical protein